MDPSGIFMNLLWLYFLVAGVICNGDSREFSQHLSNCQLLSRPLGGEGYCTSSFFLMQQWPFYGWNMMNLIWSVGIAKGFGPPNEVLRSSYLPMMTLRGVGGNTNPCHEATPLKALHLGASRRRIALSLLMECCQVRRRRQDIWKGRRRVDGDGIFECLNMRWSYDLDRNNWSHTSFIRKDIKYVFLSSNCCCPRCQANSSGRVATAPAEVSRKKDFKVGYHWGIDFHIMAPTAVSWRNLWSQLTSK